MSHHHAKFATVQELRDKGNKVSVFHLRRYWQINKKGLPEIEYFPACVRDVKAALPTGGLTAVRVITLEGDELVGWADCSETEHYCRQRGVKIALNRALTRPQKLDVRR